MQLYYTIRILKSISYFCSAQFLWFSYLCKLIYSIQLPSASLQLAVCCRRIHGNKDSLHPVGCRSTDNKNTPLHVNMQGASLLSDICSADAVFIKLYSARYHSNSTKTNAFCLGIILCNVSRSFDYLIYPYYPAYTS